MDVQAWESTVIGQILDTDGVAADKGQCSQVVVSWMEFVNKNVPWTQQLPPLGNEGVANWAGKSTKFWTWIENNHNDVHQLPMPGAIMIFGPTPAKGYTDTFANPSGHDGVCKSASVSGYTLVQQDAPNPGQPVNDTSYPWSYRPCLGWFVPANQAAAAPNPAPAPAVAPVSSVNVGKTLGLPASVKSWWTFSPEGPYDQAHHKGAIAGNQSFKIVKDLGNGLYLIDTKDYGQVAVWGVAPLTVH